MTPPSRGTGPVFAPPHLRGPLASPVDIPTIVNRGKILSDEHGHLFDHATPVEAVRALFAGWTLCGTRADARRSRQTCVLRSDNMWVGFDFFAEAAVASMPTTMDPEQFIDYLHLMRSTRERPAWDTLAGADRIRRVSNALRLRGKDAPVIMDGPVAFFHEIGDRCNLLPPGGDLAHYRLMVEIVLTEDITDPDGELASARMLAGLGAFAFPPNIPTRITRLPGMPTFVISRADEC